MGNFLRRLFALLLALVFCWEFLPGATFAQTNNKAPTSQSNQFSIQPYLDRVVENLTEFKLDNGMKFIVLRRPQAPVVSFLTYADVGGVDEPDGKTGIAHFLEHLAFKGTDRIGTKNYAKEKRLLERLDKLAEQVKQAQAAGEKDKVAQLEAEFKKIEEEAHNTVKQNELGRIVEQAGGVGLNATTSAEATKYFYSFPANKLELWMSLESERFLNPELRREFYKEKDVILEERRLRVDNSPIGQMIEKFNDTAFEKHPYKRPVIGYEKDIRNLTTEDLQQFFKTHYVPSNLTVAVVGDVQAAEVKKLAAIYFGRYE
ncbi:MAG: pitrilysin family protein, partial [Cyanobacteria bacterium J06641_2]